MAVPTPSGEPVAGGVQVELPSHAEKNKTQKGPVVRAGTFPDMLTPRGLKLVPKAEAHWKDWTEGCFLFFMHVVLLALRTKMLHRLAQVRPMLSMPSLWEWRSPRFHQVSEQLGGAAGEPFRIREPFPLKASEESGSCVALYGFVGVRPQKRGTRSPCEFEKLSVVKCHRIQ